MDRDGNYLSAFRKNKSKDDSCEHRTHLRRRYFNLIDIDSTA